MVKAIINIQDNSNRVLNIIKAKFGLRDKSAAIDVMAQQYEQEILEPELRPEYIEKMKKIAKNKKIYIGDMKDFDKMFGLDKYV